MLKDTDYLYITARIRAKETNLLKADDYRKMASSTRAELAKILSAHGYAVTAEDASVPHFADGAVARQRGELFAMLKKDAPDSRYFNFFLYPEDYLNIKVLLKNTLLAGNSAPLSQDGSVPPARMKAAAETGEEAFVTPLMAKAIEEGKRAYAKTADPQSVDLAVDCCCFADMAEAAESSHNAFLQSYVKLLIDIANVKAFFRMKKMGKTAFFADNVFVPGGSVKKEFYCRLFDGKEEDFAAAAKATDIDSLVVMAMSFVDVAGGMGKMEKEMDLRLLAFAKKAALSPFGADAVAAYLIQKEMEFKNIRILAAGVDAKVSPDAIMERVRVYE